MDSMKFGFITIVYNHSFYDKLYKRLFDNEIPRENADIIILFDDELEQIVIDIKETLQTIPNIILSPDTYYSTPFMIEKNNILHIKERGSKIDGYSIFKSYMSNDEYKKNTDPSIYNCKYYKLDKHENKLTTFALIKKKYGFDSSRYLFAYDPNEFTRDEVQYIISCIFRSET